MSQSGSSTQIIYWSPPQSLSIPSPPTSVTTVGSSFSAGSTARSGDGSGPILATTDVLMGDVSWNSDGISDNQVSNF